MFLLRKIGKLLRGSATPFQIHLACTLGSMLGFVPSFTRSPALVVGLVLALAILNANLMVAGFVASMAKLASLALMGVSFAAGRFLLDGPTSGTFASAINAPVLAFCGLEWYVCAGGLLLGLLFGIVAGVVLSLPLKYFRVAMTKVEEKAFYEQNQKKPLVRLAFFILFGPRHDWARYRELLTRKVGMPIRIPGVIAAALVVGGIWFFAARLAQPLLAAGLKDGLESANGATVDLGQVELDVGNNKLAVHDLAMADAEELDHDLFRAALLECDVSGTDLLRKRLKLDRVVVRDAVNGARRATPGVRTAPETEPSPAPPASDSEEKTLDDWLATAQTWKARLKQAKEWLDKVKRPAGAGPGGAGEEGDRETLEERLEREVAAKGWRNVAATHLVQGAPLFEVGTLIVDGMKSEKLEGRPLDLTIANLSTNPALVDGAPRFTLKTRDGGLTIDVALGSEARVPAQSFLDLRCAGLPTATIMSQVEAKTGVKTLEGGTIDAGFRLAWSAGGIAAFDTPLDVKVKDATVTLPKLGAATVKELAIPLLLRGPLDNPRVKLDAGKLADNLIAAGADALGQQLKAETQRRLDAAAGELEQKAIDTVSDALEKAQQGGIKDAAEDARKALDDLNPFGKKKPKDGKSGQDGSKKDGG